MAKDPWKNQPNYKIGGGQLNEYEFNRQHGALTEQEHSHLPGQPQGQAGEAATDAQPAEGDPNESPEARRIRELMEEVHEKVVRRGGAQKTAGAKKSGAPKKAAKKSSVRRATKSASKGAAKSGAKKPGGGAPKRASGAKKSGARASSGGAKKGGAKKSSKKSAGSKKGARGR
ncbi:MAG: hypothetical protein M3268_03415 [Acidobacteriota bacterium]|nr:hypothetical protein [Acidobacteriota bacterium]